MKDTNQRGMLTDAIKAKYPTLTLKKLRLLPYLQYLIMNSMPVDPAKIDSEERTILGEWRDKGYISYSMTEPCACTRIFWNMMNDILFNTYALELEGEPSRSVIIVPEGETNGDMIEEITGRKPFIDAAGSPYMIFNKKWWDAPYKVESEE